MEVRARTRAAAAQPLQRSAPQARQRVREAGAVAAIDGLARSFVRATHESAGVQTVLAEDNQTVPWPVPGNGPHGRVKVNAGVTIQPRDYESVRVDVGLELPCAATHAEVERAYEASSKWVSDKLSEQIDSLRS